MLTRKNYNKIFFRTYLGILIPWVLLCIAVEVYKCEDFRIPGLDDDLLLPMLSASRLILSVFGMLFLLPALCTWAVAALVRMTNNLAPLSEEEQQRSLIERMSRTQLFLPLSIVLFAFPLLYTHYINSTFIPGMDFYPLAVLHFLATWLLVLLFQRIARIRKSGRKTLALIGFILLGIAYEITATTFIFRHSEPTYLYFERRDNIEYPDSCDDEGSQSIYDEMDQEALANQQTDRLLDVYDYYCDRDMSVLFRVGGRLLEYSEYRNFVVGLSSDDSPEEVAHKNTLAEENFEKEQELSRFYQWFKDLDVTDMNSLIALLSKAMREMNGRYNYKDFAQYVDMLDMAYNDLNARWTEDSDDPFEAVYLQASETAITWENFRNIITDPYVRYSVAKDGNAQYMLLWAYSFWGRRNHDGTLWLWHNLLDHVLEVHPNTYYPDSLFANQSQIYTRATARVKEFLTWYKANYWSFRELKAASYDSQGNLEKIDRDEFSKYLRALKKSGYVSPRLLKKLEEDFDKKADRIRIANLSKKPGEWLREDPLMAGYNALAGEFDEAGLYIDSILELNKSMHIATSLDGLGVNVEIIDGEWFVSEITN